MVFTEENPQRLDVTFGSSNCAKQTVTFLDRDETRGKRGSRNPTDRN
jgi:hypothetical protein